MSDWDAKSLGGSIKRGIVNPDLKQERDSCAFDKLEFEQFMLGTKLQAYLAEKHAVFQSNPKMRLPENDYELSREEIMEEWWRVIYHTL